MSQMKMLWLAIGLSVLGALIMWFGMFYEDTLLYFGLAVFAVGMVIGPATRFLGEDEDEGEEENQKEGEKSAKKNRSKRR
jgi:hypothetical protein